MSHFLIAQGVTNEEMGMQDFKYQYSRMGSVGMFVGLQLFVGSVNIYYTSHNEEADLISFKILTVFGGMHAPLPNFLLGWAIIDVYLRKAHKRQQKIM